MTRPPQKSPRRTRGFERTSGLLQTQIRKAGEKRGFAVARLLTHWAEIVGEDMARAARPVKVGYGKGGFGATLTVLTTGAQAPMLDMQKEQIRDKVNACYGYRAISRVRVTQTAPTGFAEGRVAFDPAPKKTETTRPNPAVKAQVQSTTAEIGDDGLRRALEALGENIISQSKRI